jgi:hypothetical protein
VVSNASIILSLVPIALFSIFSIDEKYIVLPFMLGLAGHFFCRFRSNPPCPRCAEPYSGKHYNLYRRSCSRCRLPLWSKKLLKNYKKRFLLFNFKEIDMTTTFNSTEVADKISKDTIDSVEDRYNYSTHYSFKGLVSPQEARLFIAGNKERADIQLYFKETINGTDITLRYRLYRSYLLELIKWLFIVPLTISLAVYAKNHSTANIDILINSIGVLNVLCWGLFYYLYNKKMNYYKEKLPRILNWVLENN